MEEPPVVITWVQSKLQRTSWLGNHFPQLQPLILVVPTPPEAEDRLWARQRGYLTYYVRFCDNVQDPELAAVCDSANERKSKFWRFYKIVDHEMEEDHDKPVMCNSCKEFLYGQEPIVLRVFRTDMCEADQYEDYYSLVSKKEHERFRKTKGAHRQ